MKTLPGKNVPGIFYHNKIYMVYNYKSQIKNEVIKDKEFENIKNWLKGRSFGH